ncbi:MAG: beta-hydroxyacyl-ACP dehydratase [Planctomycetota bacterium]|nr:MAG: beta-hydroxyacyl-ACP dehydratase [Planctomycetota bacterium]
MGKRLCDPKEWLDAPLICDLDGVHKLIPQRHELGLLHGVMHYDNEAHLAIGFHDSSLDDFWVRGHIPGRPLMPGVVMVEAAAQLCAWISRDIIETAEDEMFGFGGVNKARFRGQVEPGERLIIAAQVVRLRRTMGIFATQIFAHDELVYEAEVIGISL